MAIADNICAHLSKMIQVGFVELRGATPEDLKPFWLFQHDLYTIEHMLICNDRMYIPATVREEVPKCLHSAHQGAAKTNSAARMRSFWPGMDTVVNQKRHQCQTCNGMAPTNFKELAKFLQEHFQ